MLLYAPNVMLLDLGQKARAWASEAGTPGRASLALRPEEWIIIDSEKGTVNRTVAISEISQGPPSPSLRPGSWFGGSHLSQKSRASPQDNFSLPLTNYWWPPGSISGGGLVAPCWDGVCCSGQGRCCGRPTCTQPNSEGNLLPSRPPCGCMRRKGREAGLVGVTGLSQPEAPAECRTWGTSPCGILHVNTS